MNAFNRGSAVAVMQSDSNSFDSMSIATANRVQDGIVELSDGRLYRQSGERYLSGDGHTYIVPVTQWHISAVHKRCLQQSRNRSG
jgi:hypothetical protein